MDRQDLTASVLGILKISLPTAFLTKRQASRTAFRWVDSANQNRGDAFSGLFSTRTETRQIKRLRLAGQRHVFISRSSGRRNQQKPEASAFRLIISRQGVFPNMALSSLVPCPPRTNWSVRSRQFDGECEQTSCRSHSCTVVV